MIENQQQNRDIIGREQVALINDSFQNRKQYNIPKAQLVIADIPYNVGNNAYASQACWYEGNDIKNGCSKKANSQFFDTDKNFNLNEFFHFCSKLLKPEPKETGKAGCLIIFSAYEQQPKLIEIAKNFGFKNYIPLNFYKNYSPQVLKANMRIVGNTEYALLFYRDKLPKFNNGGKMVFNSMYMPKDNITPRIHPTQKPIETIKQLILLFTDVGEVIIDPCAGSGVTLLAAKQLNRRAYGFEIKKEFVQGFYDKLLNNVQQNLFCYSN
jgi:site-specific DNA-methyltransferase (adenine-specific)